MATISIEILDEILESFNNEPMGKGELKCQQFQCFMEF